MLLSKCNIFKNFQGNSTPAALSRGGINEHYLSENIPKGPLIRHFASEAWRACATYTPFPSKGKALRASPEGTPRYALFKFCTIHSLPPLGEVAQRSCGERGKCSPTPHYLKHSQHYPNPITHNSIRR